MIQTIKLKTVKIPIMISSAQCGYGSNLNDGTEYIELEVPEDYVQDDKNFAVYASGDSMEPELRSGDLLIVSTAVNAVHGDMVMAIVHGDITIKKLEHRNYSSYLVPINPAYKEIKIEGEAFVVGVVLASRRLYKK